MMTKLEIVHHDTINCIKLANFQTSLKILSFDIEPLLLLVSETVLGVAEPDTMSWTKLVKRLILWLNL